MMIYFQEQYIIKLRDDEQCVCLYGFHLSVKRTLTWRDVLEQPAINMATCVAAGIPVEKLHRMQPNIREWIDSSKATIRDAALMRPWHPNPFTDLHCAIADLVLHRTLLTPRMLMESGVTFRLLVDRYGLVPELMVLLKYDIEDWFGLGIDAAFISALSDETLYCIFGPNARRNDLILRTAMTNTPSQV